MEFLIKRKPLITRLLILFYTIGAIGFMTPCLSSMFFQLTPIALLTTFFLMLLYHENRYNLKTIFLFVFIYLFGFIIEIIGVKTGVIFGSYSYGSGLGLKLWETPLIIGVNWLLLTYTTHSLVSKWNIVPFLRITLASGMMLIYDLILEQAAPFMDMWSFSNLEVPIQNYIIWFLLSFLFHTLLTLFKIDTRNKMASKIFIIQLLFFTVLMVYFKIFS
jgi:putative membrane protein